MAFTERMHSPSHGRKTVDLTQSFAEIDGDERASLIPKAEDSKEQCLRTLGSTSKCKTFVCIGIGILLILTAGIGLYVTLSRSFGYLSGCPSQSLPAFVQGSCTKNNNVYSKCTFSCSQGKHLLGNSSATCTTSGQWSNKPPICKSVDKCQPCQTGPNCTFIRSWAKLKTYVTNLQPWGTVTARYDGRSILCRMNKKGGLFPVKWNCYCIDVVSSESVKCYNYKSPSGSCEHALAALVKQMIDKGIYPEPCDALPKDDDRCYSTEAHAR